MARPADPAPRLADTVHGAVIAYVLGAAADPTTLDCLRDDIAKIVEGHPAVGSVATTPQGTTGACVMEVYDYDEQQIAVVTIGADGTVEALPAGDPTPAQTPADWHRYIRSARTFSEAQDRMEEARLAGVDFADLNAVASEGC